jgi:hypothetical protein
MYIKEKKTKKISLLILLLHLLIFEYVVLNWIHIFKTKIKKKTIKYQEEN